MPTAHANLGPSAAHRWITCPASVRASAGVPTTTSVYAEEGTRAHTLAELEASYAFGLIGRGPYLQRHRKAWAEVKAAGDDQEEMSICVDDYVTLLRGFIEGLGPTTQVRLEQRVDTGVPECWGTADAVIVTPSVLQVVDFKYGKGVRVNAQGNPQLRLYGLGALDQYELLGDIQEVRLTVFQPRLDHVSTEIVSADELRAWRGRVAGPAARIALGDNAPFNPTEEACRFCPVAGDCRARMEKVTQEDFGQPDLLTADEMAEALDRVSEIKAWLGALEERALERAYHQGEKIPGYKVVMSGGKRVIRDPAIAIQTLIDHGYNAEQVSRVQPQTLGALEKLVGKAELGTILGDLLQKTAGREALVPEDDPRPEERSASNDFDVVS